MGKIFPARLVPGLFRKHAKKVTDMVQERRRQFLQRTVNSLLSDKEYRNCAYLLAFLSKNDTDWEYIAK